MTNSPTEVLNDLYKIIPAMPDENNSGSTWVNNEDTLSNPLDSMY